VICGRCVQFIYMCLYLYGFNSYKWHVLQGCQIILGTTYQNGEKYTKLQQK
jgi:hypothetical protein